MADKQSKKIKHNHPIYPPSLMDLNGKKYLMPGWLEVPLDTTLDDIDWTPPEAPKQTGEWEFESSSSPGLMYKVREVSGSLTCDCPGHQYRKVKFKHIKSVENDK